MNLFDKSKDILMVLALGIIIFIIVLYFEKPNEDQIMNRMASAVDNVDFYGFDINITFRNMGYQADRYLDIKMIINGIGRVDIKNKIAKFITDVNVSSSDLQSRPYFEEGIEMYIVNDTVYTIPFGAWVENKIHEDRNLWNNQTHIKQQLDIMKNAKIKIIGDEFIGGVTTYRINIEPDRNKLIEHIFKTSAIREPNYGKIENLTDSITALNMDLWVSKNNYLPVKSLIHIETYINNITSDMTVVTNFYDYNKKSEIKLPDLSNVVEIMD